MQQVIQDLTRVSTGEAPAGTKCSLTRIRRGGTPLLWEETISIELGGKAHYSSLRSFVDAAGWPIGIWETPANEQTVRALARTLLEVKFWDIPIPPVAPGGEENRWECSVGNGVISLSADDGPGILMKMAKVDLLFRRIANDLIASRSGAALNCKLHISHRGTTAEVEVALVNEGNMDFQIQNPLKSPDVRNNFLRVEIGAVPAEVPGVTGSEIAYKPLDFPDTGKPSAPWDQDCIILKAGQEVIWPFKLPIDLSARRGQFVRAIYSHYGTTRTHAGLPLVRGRVLSSETQLK